MYGKSVVALFVVLFAVFGRAEMCKPITREVFGDLRLIRKDFDFGPLNGLRDRLQRRQDQIESLLKDTKLTAEDLAKTYSLPLLREAKRQALDLHICAENLADWYRGGAVFDEDARELYQQAYAKEKHYKAKLNLIEAAIRLLERQLTD